MLFQWVMSYDVSNKWTVCRIVRPFAALRVTGSHRRHVDPKGKHLTVRPFAALRVTAEGETPHSDALRCAQGDGLAVRETAEGETPHSEALRCAQGDEHDGPAVFLSAAKDLTL